MDKVKAFYRRNKKEFWTAWLTGAITGVVILVITHRDEVVGIKVIADPYFDAIDREDGLVHVLLTRRNGKTFGFDLIPEFTTPGGEK